MFSYVYVVVPSCFVGLLLVVLREFVWYRVPFRLRLRLRVCLHVCRFHARCAVYRALSTTILVVRIRVLDVPGPRFAFTFLFLTSRRASAGARCGRTDTGR